MDLGMKGRVAIVTGAAGGIGAAVALQLAQEGCAVGLIDRPGAPLQPLADEIQALGVCTSVMEADVTDYDAATANLEQIQGELGAIDILVCCAGITRDNVSWKIAEEDFDAVIAVNLKGTFNYNRAAALVLKEKGWGRIVNIASINGMRGKFGQASYTASKGGVIALTKTMARELGRAQTTVNCVAPGLVLTEITAAMPAEAIEVSRAETVLGKLATAQDIAQTVCFLCSDAAGHVTGEVIKVDGGQYI